MVMGLPPGMMQMIAQMGLTNPAQLAAMAAAKGIQPPGGMMGGGGTGMMMGGAGTDTLAAPAIPASPPMATRGGFQANAMAGAPAPGPTPAQIAAVTGPAANAMGALTTPSAAGAGGGNVQAPAPFIPGALASQMPQIMQLLMRGNPMVPSLGSQILGG